MNSSVTHMDAPWCIRKSHRIPHWTGLCHTHSEHPASLPVTKWQQCSALVVTAKYPRHFPKDLKGIVHPVKNESLFRIHHTISACYRGWSILLNNYNNEVKLLYRRIPVPPCFSLAFSLRALSIMERSSIWSHILLALTSERWIMACIFFIFSEGS